MRYTSIQVPEQSNALCRNLGNTKALPPTPRSSRRPSILSTLTENRHACRCARGKRARAQASFPFALRARARHTPEQQGHVAPLTREGFPRRPDAGPGLRPTDPPGSAPLDRAHTLATHPCTRAATGRGSERPRRPAGERQNRCCYLQPGWSEHEGARPLARTI